MDERQLEDRMRKAGIDADAVRRSAEELSLDPDLHGFLPRILPSGWIESDRGADGARYSWGGGLLVIVSASRELDGKRWLHVSLSRRTKGSMRKTKLPTYDDIRLVKRIFVGRDRKAIEVHPPESEHVNLHNHVRHLFACLDDDPLPDFTRGLRTL